MRDTCMTKPPCLAIATSGFERTNLRTCVMHVSSAGTSSVEGHSCLSISFRVSKSLVSHVFFSGCVYACEHVFFLTRNGVDSGECGLIRIVLFQRHILLFRVISYERQLARAAHPAGKTKKATRRWQGGRTLQRAPPVAVLSLQPLGQLERNANADVQTLA